MKPRPLPDFTNVPITFLGPMNDIPAKQVPGYENYFVTNDSRVWKKYAPSNKRLGRWLKPWSGPTHNGYLLVALMNHGKRRQFLLHRLAGAAWLPPPNDPLRNEINHKNCDKANCDPSNIEWSSHIENIQHALRHGRWNPGQSMTSERAKEMWADPQHRRKMIKAIKRRWKDPEERRKASEKACEQWNRPGVRERRAERSKGLWKDPAYRAGVAAGRLHMSAVDIKSMAAQLKAGKTKTEVAQLFNTTKAHVNEAMKLWKRYQTHIADIVRLKGGGLTLRQIAPTVRLNHRMVRRLLTMYRQLNPNDPVAPPWKRPRVAFF